MSEQPGKNEIPQDLQAKPLVNETKTTKNNVSTLLLGGGIAVILLAVVGGYFFTKTQVSQLSINPVVVGLSGVYGIDAAQVNNEDIRYADFARDVHSLEHFYANNPNQLPPGQDATREYVSELVLGRLAFNALLEDLAKEHNVMVSDEAVDAEINAIAETFEGGRDELALDVIDRYDQTLEEYSRNVIKPLLLEQALQQQLFPEVFKEGLSEEELIAVAQDIASQIESGEATFEEMAEMYGTDGTRTQGGDLGFFERGVMVPEFEEAIFSMSVNEIRVVATDFGVHVVQLTAIEPESADEPEQRQARHILFGPHAKTYDVRQAEQKEVDEFFRNVIVDAQYDIYIPVADPFAAASASI